MKATFAMRAAYHARGRRTSGSGAPLEGNALTKCLEARIGDLWHHPALPGGLQMEISARIKATEVLIAK